MLPKPLRLPGPVALSLSRDNQYLKFCVYHSIEFKKYILPYMCIQFFMDFNIVVHFKQVS